MSKKLDRMKRRHIDLNVKAELKPLNKVGYWVSQVLAPE